MSGYTLSQYRASKSLSIFSESVIAVKTESVGGLKILELMEPPVMPPGKPSAKRGGRPDPETSRGGTKSLRVYEDLFEMAYWITEVTGEKSAELLDPMLRKPITEKYDQFRAAIDALKAARAKAGKRS